MGEMRDAYKILAGKPERRRPLGRSRHRWEDNIKMDLKIIMMRGCELDSNGSGQGQMADSCEYGNET
jgi:hypothetical protein